MKIQKKGDWLTAKVGGDLVMMSAEKGNYLGLSEVGARIWDLLDTMKDIEAICVQLQEEYDVTPALCRAEVETFVSELVKQDAIAIDTSPAA